MQTITVNLIDRAADALEFAATLELDTSTDTVNRALQVYAMLVREHALGTELWLVDPRPRRRWWQLSTQRRARRVELL